MFEWKSNWRTLLIVAALQRAPAALADAPPHVNVPYLVAAQSEAIAQNVQVAVQQAISALPPTGGQQVIWVLPPVGPEPVLVPGTKTRHLGPIAFRTPEVMPAESFSARLALSYFDLSARFAPVAYVGTGPELGNVAYATKLGLSLDTKATIVSLSSTYGIATDVDVSLTVPITFVRANARSTFTTSSGADGGGPQAPYFADTAPADAVGMLDAMLADGSVVFGQADARSVGSVLESGTQIGLGRIGIAFKEQLVSQPWLSLSIAQELSLPSPSSDELAGTDSFGALPRLILAAPLFGVGRLHVDAGYEFDSQFKELWRAVWDVGASLWIKSGEIDFGFGGSEYLQELHWSPRSLSLNAAANSASPGTDVRIDWVAQSDTGVGGTNYVDFLAGAKYELADAIVGGVAVSVPVTNDGIRPAAIGTVTLEYLF